MPRSLIWKLAVLCALLAGAFALGRVTAPNRSASNPDATPATGIPNSGLANRTPQKPPSTPGSSATQVKSALKRLDQTVASEQREDERLKLLLDWAATDPLGAMDYAKQNLKRDRLAQAIAGIAAVWAKHDPAAAWSWARSLGPDETHHAHTVLEEVGRNDPAMAARFANEFARQQPDQAVAMCLTAMRAMSHTGNFDAARKLAREVQLASPEDQALLLNFMAGQWARFEPEKAAQWVQSLPAGAARDQALIGLGESWAEVDPPRAADFAAQLPPGESRQAALRQAIANWILTDPSQASTWINKFEPHEDFDQAVASVATMRFLVEEHAELALNWANTIFNEPLRMAVLGEIVSQWALRDRAAAQNHVRNLPNLSAEAREQLLRRLQSAE